MEMKKAKFTKIVLMACTIFLIFIATHAVRSQEVLQSVVDPSLLSNTISATTITSVPYTISTSGSYSLSSNLQTTSGSQNAITVNADNVTIDLNGYSLIGTGSGTGCGIYMNSRQNVEIKNGTVRNFGDSGIFEAKGYSPGEVFGQGHRVINVRALNNGNAGIMLFGENHLIIDCTCIENLYGIVTHSGGSITNNICKGNSYGLMVSFSCFINNNVLRVNNYGIYAYYDGNFIKNNSLTGNTTCIYVDGTDNAIEENLLTGSTYGIYFNGTGNFYANNRAAGNSNTNYHNASNQKDGGGNNSF